MEPPGTAPGSDRFITTAVYRHIRPLRDGTLNIGTCALRRKENSSRIEKSCVFRVDDAAPAPDPEEVVLLREIRAALKSKG